MALTLAQLTAVLELALGGPLPAAFSSAMVVNFAGRHLYTMHTWRWAERPPVSIDFVADQAYADLPADFVQVLGVWAGAGISSCFQLTTVNHVLQLRREGGQSLGYYGAVVQPIPSGATSAMGAMRLEIYPTPAADVADAVSIQYRGGWVDLTDPSHVAKVPAWMESLLIDVVLASGRGFIEDRLGELLDTVARGSVFASKVQADGLVQAEHGEIRRGAMSDLLLSEDYGGY